MPESKARPGVLAATVLPPIHDGRAFEEFVRSTGWKVRDQSEVMSITHQVQNRLEAISIMIYEEKYREALDEIENFLKKTRSHYVEATLYQMQGYVHGIQSNEDLSIESF